MKNKGKKIILMICAVVIAILLVSSFFITVDFPAQAKDLRLYRLAGVLLLAVFEIGLLLEMNLLGLRKKIPLISGKCFGKHVLFWFITAVVACVLFAIPYSMTSADFKEQFNKKELVIKVNKESTSKEEPETEDRADLPATDEKPQEEQESGKTEKPQQEQQSKPEEEPEKPAEKEPLTWKRLAKDANRYKLVMSLLGENLNKGTYEDSAYSDLSEEEKQLVQTLYDYVGQKNDLPKEFTKAFTGFCVGKEFEDMFLEMEEHPFYAALSDSFTISWKSDDTYYIGLKENIDQTEPENTSRFVGTKGCEFTVREPFELDGVLYTIKRIKISSDLDSESPAHNYYQIFYEYTIQNNRNETIEWDMAYNGNLYGQLCHRGVERRLGGNSNIKDSSFEGLKYNPEGTLAAGEEISGYNSLVCMPNQVDLPAETWPLYTDEPFSLSLHLLVNDTDYSLNISFNQNEEQ